MNLAKLTCASNEDDSCEVAQSPSAQGSDCVILYNDRDLQEPDDDEVQPNRKPDWVCCSSPNMLQISRKLVVNRPVWKEMQPLLASSRGLLGHLEGV